MSSLLRKRLFRKSKPFIRPFSMDDLWVFWAAYREGSFIGVIKDDLDKNQFYEWLLGDMAKHGANLVVEDANKMFKDGRGIVCVIAIDSEGCRIVPYARFFSWASKANILRVNVRFLNWCRYNKVVGSCLVRCLKPSVNLFHHVTKYGVLYYIGRIPGGDPATGKDEYIFSIKGKYGEVNQPSLMRTQTCI